jgi:murein DD-endopeptidase MepM/ murein hydrolase activator NlpD
VDLGLSQGTEIRAGFNGVVARVNRGCAAGNYGCGNGYGNYIYLKATDATCAVTAHVSRIDVNPGQQVAQHALLGASGNTGNSTGPHLHYDRVDCNSNRSMP